MIWRKCGGVSAFRITKLIMTIMRMTAMLMMIMLMMEKTAIAKNGLCICRAVVDYILSCNSMQNMPQDKM